MSKLLAASIYQEVIFARYYYLLALTEPLGNIASWDKTYSTNVVFEPNALTKRTSKSFRLHQAIQLLVTVL